MVRQWRLSRMLQRRWLQLATLTPDTHNVAELWLHRLHAFVPVKSDAHSALGSLPWGRGGGGSDPHVTIFTTLLANPCIHMLRIDCGLGSLPTSYGWDRFPHVFA